MKIEFSSQRREMLLFLATNMAQTSNILTSGSIGVIVSFAQKPFSLIQPG